MVERNESVSSGQAMSDALKGLRDMIERLNGCSYECDHLGHGRGHDPDCTFVLFTELESLLPQLEQAIRAEVQAAEAAALCKVLRFIENVSATAYSLHTLAIDVEKLIPVSGQLVALDRVVAEAVEKAVQAAEANALRKAADLFSGKLNGYTPGEIVPMILSLIPPASQTLLDARDAETRSKTFCEAADIAEREPKVWDENAPYPQHRIARKLRAASQPTPSAGKGK